MQWSSLQKFSLSATEGSLPAVQPAGCPRHQRVWAIFYTANQPQK
jgi:hypothetical protein